MRIIGDIVHPVMKITVFKMDDKRAIKFETGLLEQTYKFRAYDGCSTFEEIQNIVDNAFIKSVETQFANMGVIKQTVFQKLHSTDVNDEFEEII